MRKERMNNKGFSLVELIIVIAIMAILAAALAPQLMKYIEKSRVSTDSTSCSSIESCVNAALADEKAYKAEIMAYMKGKDKKETSAMLEFAAFTQKEVENNGVDTLKEDMQFNELEALNANIDIIKSLTKVQKINIVEYTESNRPKGAKEPAIPGKPLFVQE